MSKPTHTQATEQKETQDAQRQELMQEEKAVVSKDLPTSNQSYSAVSEGKNDENQATDQEPQQQTDHQPQWQGCFISVTLDHYYRQLHQPRHQTEPQRRLTLPIPDDLHREIKVYCAHHDLHIGAWVGALLHTGFKQVTQTETPSV